MNIAQLSIYSSVLLGTLLGGCASSGHSAGHSNGHRNIAQTAAPTPADCLAKTAAPLPDNPPATQYYPTVDIRPEVYQRDQNRGLTQYYFSPAVREQHRFVVFNGTVYQNDCTLMNMPDGLDATGAAQEVNYVMDKFGNFYWVDENKNTLTRHSAIFSAAPVSGAGNITIDQSKITLIDSASGHYPSGPVFSNVLSQLQLDGVDLSTVAVTKSPNNNP